MKLKRIAWWCITLALVAYMAVWDAMPEKRSTPVGIVALLVFAGQLIYEIRVALEKPEK